MDKDRIERSPCRLRREVGEVIEIITNFAVERCQVNRIDTEVLRKTLFGLRQPAAAFSFTACCEHSVESTDDCQPQRNAFQHLIAHHLPVRWRQIVLRFGSTNGFRRLNGNIAKRQCGKSVFTVEQVVRAPIGTVEVGHCLRIRWSLQLQRNTASVHGA